MASVNFPNMCIILILFSNLAFKVEKNYTVVEKHSANSFRYFEKRGLGPVSRKSRSLTEPDKYIFKCFFADYTVITDMVLRQCFHRIIRFKKILFKANKN